jgi:GNAT superfamily N-acetyltransferase
LYAVAPREIGELEADLAEMGRCRRVVIEHDTPDWVEAELSMRGWEIDSDLRLELAPETKLAGPPPLIDVRPAGELDPTGRLGPRCFAATTSERTRRGLAPRTVAQTAATVAHRQDLERHAHYLGAVSSGALVGFLCTWSDGADRGVIEDVFVHPDHRSAGVATALLHNAVRTLREQGARHVTIPAELEDTPRHLYARLGFRPRRLVRSCLLPDEAAPAP